MKLDINSNEFIANNDIFADLINVNYFHGRHVIEPDDLAMIKIKS